MIVTGIRLPSETDAVRAAGAVTVRLDVSPEVQAERALARDGHLPAPEALEHPTEVSQDDRTDWGLQIDTSGFDVTQVLDFVLSSLEGLLSP